MNAIAAISRAVSPLLAAALLASCAPSSATGLKQEAAERKQEVTIDLNYQRVYKNLVETARACTEGTAGLVMTATAVIQADLYTELGEANVSYAFVHIDRRVLMTADIKKIADNKTTLILYPRWNTGYMARDWTRWAQGDTNCSESASVAPSDQSQSSTPGVRTPGGRL